VPEIAAFWARFDKNSSKPLGTGSSRNGKQ
jgi:hypothetical protein